MLEAVLPGVWGASGLDLGRWEQTLSSPGWLRTWAALDSGRSRSGGGVVSSRYRDIRDTYQRQALLERKDVLLSSQDAESQVLLIKDWFKWDFNLATPYIQPKGHPSPRFLSLWLLITKQG